jgi:hypothetical protein
VATLPRTLFRGGRDSDPQLDFGICRLPDGFVRYDIAVGPPVGAPTQLASAKLRDREAITEGGDQEMRSWALLEEQPAVSSLRHAHIRSVIGRALSDTLVGTEHISRKAADADRAIFLYSCVPKTASA